jgi:hypothetical protein
MAANSSFRGDLISRCTLLTTMIEAVNKRVSVPGFKVGDLHHFRDTEFVDQLGSEAWSIASDLIDHASLQNPGAGLVTMRPRRFGPRGQS